jgi:hypothetical protein
MRERASVKITRIVDVAIRKVELIVKFVVNITLKFGNYTVISGVVCVPLSTEIKEIRGPF